MTKFHASSSPLVSVICCTYNAGRFLPLAVDSILRQTYGNFELFVVDDGSTDNSISLLSDIADSRMRIIRQENGGRAVALNRALTEISGEYYMIQDADDLSDPRRIERQAQFLEGDATLAAVFCGHELIIGKHRLAPRLRAKKPDECREDIKAMRMPAHDPTAMYRRDMVRNIEYDAALRIGAGYDYILRVGEEWPMSVIGECLYSYRVGESSATTAQVEAREAAVREVLRRACARRNVKFDNSWFAQQPRRSRNRIADNGISTHCLESVVDLRANGRWPEAVRVGLQSALLHPFDYQYYRGLVAAMLPLALLRRLRSDRIRTHNA